MLGRVGPVYGGSAGVEFEFDQVLSDRGTHLYYGIGFTFFTPKPGPHYGYDNFGAWASFSYGKVPVIPLIVGIRQGLLPNARVKPMLGFNMGYYFTYYDERSRSVLGDNGDTVAGGMVGFAPCMGLQANYDRPISFGMDCRWNFMMNFDIPFYFSYLDVGVFLNFAL